MFTTEENVYATGHCFTAGASLDIYIVEDLTWTDQMDIPSDVSGDGIDTILTDSAGNFGPVNVWSLPLPVGEYDMVFDANQNGTYDAGIDVVDDPNDPGFTVIDPCTGLGGDTDGDKICDDGDGSGTAGDNPCTGGETENCDDNCPDDPNPDQADTDGDGIGDVCDMNNPPSIPSNPDPGVDTTDVELTNPVLSWLGGDPDPGDTVTYDVYFGRTDIPKIKASNQADSTFTLGKLNCYTTYYWQVIARDNHGEETPGPIWSFTTTDAGCPVIEGVDPNPCNPKDVVTISGRNFGTTKQAIRWGKSKYKKKKIVSWTDTSIAFKIKAYNKWLPGTSKTKDVWFKVGPAGSKTKSNRVPLTITKP